MRRRPTQHYARASDLVWGIDTGIAFEVTRQTTSAPSNHTPPIAIKKATRMANAPRGLSTVA